LYGTQIWISTCKSDNVVLQTLQHRQGAAVMSNFNACLISVTQNPLKLTNEKAKFIVRKRKIGSSL
jgi:hypothetical protein